MTREQVGAGEPSVTLSMGSLARVEDWAIAAWVVLGAPLLARTAASTGPFDPRQPLQGIFRLGAVLAALACLAARRPSGAVGTGGQILDSAAVGPFTGGLLLVAISGGIALDLPSWGPIGFCLLAAGVMIAMRVAVPPLPTVARRLLVTPFVMAAAGIFWSVIDAVLGPMSGGGGGGSWGSLASLSPVVLPVVGFLVAFSAVYYAMLVYAPRQVAEREGGLLAWVLRYLMFLGGVALGAGWPRVL
jgi:hypothetical protein